MNLDNAIDQLEKVIAEVRQASLVDDKTRLGSLLALRQQGRLINEGLSEFDVVVFGDLNDFKSLNDKYGHEAGNIALHKVGDSFLEIVGTDQRARAYRQSGDEFVVLLNRESLARFLSAASSLGNIRFFHKDEELRTAMSLGYAQSDGRASFEELLERAELACNSAKAVRDGACVMWSDDLLANPLTIKCQMSELWSPSYL